MKKLVAMLLVAAMVLGLVACSSAPKQENVEITFLCAEYSTETGPYIQKVIDKYQEAHPNVKITLEIVGWDNIETRINTLVGAKQAPDLFAGDSATAYIEDNLVYKPE